MVRVPGFDKLRVGGIPERGCVKLCAPRAPGLRTLTLPHTTRILRRMKIQLVLCVASVLTATFSTRASDSWPEFRGPTGQGQSALKRLPTTWSTNQNVAWRQEIPGTGWSSPVLHNGRVYLTSAVQSEGTKKQTLQTLCLDAALGKIVWATEVFQDDVAAVHKKNSQASPTPVLAGDRLYVHFGHQGTACLALDGKVIWKNNDLRYSPVHGNGGSPVLAGSALVFSADGNAEPCVVALDKDTGKLLWKTTRETSAKKKFSFSTPLVLEVNGKPQIISPGSGAVCAYDPQDGKELWRVRYGEGYSVVPRPIFGHGLLFLSSGFDQPWVYAIRPDGSGDVTDTHVAWKLTKSAPHTPSLLLVGDELYFVSDAGIASCVDAQTGAVHWQERVGKGCSASPLFADGKIYIQDEAGLGVVLQPGKEFKVLAKNALGERTFASYAAGDGALFIRTEKNLYRIQATQ